MPQRHVYPNEAYQKRKAASFGFASDEGLAAPMPSRRPHAVSSYGAAVDRSRGRNSGRRLTAPRAARGTKWGGTRQQGRIFRTRSGRRRRVSRGSQGTRRPAAYRTTQQTRSHTYIPLISKQSWLQRIDQSQPRYLLCPTCRGRSRKRRIGGNGKNSYHIEIKQFLMSKVYIIIIMGLFAIKKLSLLFDKCIVSFLDGFRRSLVVG